MSFWLGILMGVLFVPIILLFHLILNLVLFLLVRHSCGDQAAEDFVRSTKDL